MGYTFGGATTDDLTVTSSTQTNINTGNLTAGWFYPTALTAGRYLYGAGSGTTGMAIGTTTSELRFTQDRATTDDTYDTTGAGITTGKWWFIAHLWAGNNTTGDLAIWVGDEHTRPVEVTVAETVGSGNTTNATNSVAGNQTSSASLAFEGDIDRLVWMRSSGFTPGGLLYCTSATTISAETKANVLSRIVLPLWQGRNPNVTFGDPTGSSVAFIHDLDMTLTKPAAKRLATNVVMPTTDATINATLSLARGPRPSPQRLSQYPQRRRG